jgi:hypothetical protein
MPRTTLDLLLWLSQYEADALRDMSQALRAGCAGPAILTVVDKSNGCADVTYSRPVSLAMLAE